MVGNKQGEWGTEIEKHSKQRKSMCKGPLGRRMLLLKTAVVGEQRRKMAQNVAIDFHRSQIKHEWESMFGILIFILKTKRSN